MGAGSSAPAQEQEAALQGPGGEPGLGELPPGEHFPPKPCTDCAFTSSRAGAVHVVN